MKCKRCKREIQKDFVLCPYCGYRLIPDSTEIRVPEPKRKANGDYTQQVMYKGKRYTVTAPTLEEYKAKAREIRLGNIPEKEELEFVSLYDVITQYIEKKRGRLSTRTILNYESLLDTVLADAAVCSVDVIGWQKLVDSIASHYSNSWTNVAWALIKVACSDYGIELPKVKLPTPKSRSNILDDEQILTLVKHIRGHKAEANILLCLHSLRLSELYALEVEDIHDGFIFVNKTCVLDEDRRYRIENKTKTEKSTRKIPVFIDRLYEVLPPAGRIASYAPRYFTKIVKDLCKQAGLPECTPHDLRRSFASLCYSQGIPDRRIMQYGGWSSPKVMHDVYVRLYDRTSKTDAQPLMNYFNITADDPKAQ